MKGLVPSLCATPPTLLYQRVRPPFRGACTPCFTVIPSGRAGGGPEIPETEAARLEDERESERSADRICASTHGMDPAGVKDEEGVSKALQFGVNVTADPGKKEMLVPSHVPALPYAVGRDIFADPLVGCMQPICAGSLNCTFESGSSVELVYYRHYRGSWPSPEDPPDDHESTFMIALVLHEPDNKTCIHGSALSLCMNGHIDLLAPC